MFPLEFQLLAFLLLITLLIDLQLLAFLPLITFLIDLRHLPYRPTALAPLHRHRPFAGPARCRCHNSSLLLYLAVTGGPRRSLPQWRRSPLPLQPLRDQQVLALFPLGCDPSLIDRNILFSCLVSFSPHTHGTYTQSRMPYLITELVLTPRF